jgi:hypothetical protein
MQCSRYIGQEMGKLALLVLKKSTYQQVPQRFHNILYQSVQVQDYSREWHCKRLSVKSINHYHMNQLGNNLEHKDKQIYVQTLEN